MYVLKLKQSETLMKMKLTMKTLLKVETKNVSFENGRVKMDTFENADAFFDRHGGVGYGRKN